MAKKGKKSARLFEIIKNLFFFVLVFVGTFGGMWYLNRYKKIKHCHILTPLEEEMHIWPEYQKFYKKYRNRFNIVFRNVSKLTNQIEQKFLIFY